MLPYISPSTKAYKIIQAKGLFSEVNSITLYLVDLPLSISSDESLHGEPSEDFETEMSEDIGKHFLTLFQYSHF